jgi:aspartate-semialdehyde dehydrogenase
MKKLRVCIVGATGIAGQQFLPSLDNHPWMEVLCLAASERSAGKRYREALTDPKTLTLRWYVDEPMPSWAENMEVLSPDSLPMKDIDLIFTAVEADVAKEIEPIYAKEVPVISTASAFRYEEDVPIFIPGINMDHAGLLDVQKKNRNWKGFITPIPNCTTTGLAASLKPLQEKFGIKKVIMTSMQALSGAGRSPGVIGLDILDNIIPYIHKEEEKVEKETAKILGRLEGGKIKPAPIDVSATCTRVNVLDGHTEAVYVSLGRKASVEEVKKAFLEYGKEYVSLKLPSSPPALFVVHDDPLRPQPRLDRNVNGGMSVIIGRIREDKCLENGIKYVLLSHNTKLGAAKGAVAVAEYLIHKNYIVRRS